MWARYTPAKLEPPENYRTVKVLLANDRNFSGDKEWHCEPILLGSTESTLNWLTWPFQALWQTVPGGWREPKPFLFLNLLFNWDTVRA